MWNLPGPALEPVSPALAGGFSTTAPPGKSMTFSIDIDVGVDIDRDGDLDVGVNVDVETE